MKLSKQEIREQAPLLNAEFWRENDHFIITALTIFFVGMPAGGLIAYWVMTATGIARSLPPVAVIALFASIGLGAFGGFKFARTCPLVATIVLTAVLAACVQPTVAFLSDPPTPRRTTQRATEGTTEPATLLARSSAGEL